MSDEPPYVIPRHWLNRSQAGGESCERLAVLSAWSVARRYGIRDTEVVDAIVFAALDAAFAQLRKAAGATEEAQ